MMRQFELVERVKAYDPNADEDALNRAYVYAMKMHGSQMRASGDPYFSHPLDVAGILTQYKLDTSSIITALLHDTVEDTAATLDDIRTLFGPEVARLVDGVTKLNRLQITSDHAKQAENFRKLLLAMSQDIRVLMVKLADRLHNMRTLHFIRNPEKRHRIASETIEIYAPLAERIGMAAIKAELEDLAFQELHPDAKAAIETRLAFLRKQDETVVPKVIAQLHDVLKENGLEADVTGREKTPYSIWVKMGRKNISMEQLTDILAFRVLVEDLEECYRALGVIHASYPMIPDRFKDYISTPKRNGYQSIHTAVIGPERLRIEVQIRTREMHEVAELGVAAHWSYKQGSPVMDGRQYRWIRELLEILEHAASPEEFLEHTKLEMFSDQVFCFTPKGELISLPSGATPVDFAYAVHTEIGDRCVSAKVNGRLVPLRQVLRNGDQVEIATSKAQTPSPEWERFAVTGKARARIRKYVRLRRRDEYLALGRQLLERTFRTEGYTLSDKALEGVLKILRQPAVEDLIAAVGEGVIPAREVLQTVYPGLKVLPRLAGVVAPNRPRKRAENGERVSIRGMIPGMATHFARCCHPLPGDRIVGIVTTGKGITIHTIDCEQLEQFNDEPERWLDLAWENEDNGQLHIGRMTVVMTNEPGSVATMTTVIAKNKGNVTNLKTTSRQQDFCDVIVDVEVQDLRHLTNIIAALRATPSINFVERARH
ncbi:RelA/SpoT family protein [Pararhodospirillum oryzae]|uniref:GTP pyrophosphokinase rsh n=1 Tax=Pararhodospirillum oryzae TaxID=478448 RepID=A0A512H6N9_9PROT|nr:bifunctional (p)ppGpp synthetase/guanosine-3',5'-bis(diphosphate) 3'-pyrophosphohydrolase [Pararhodospirillum oryzae]GEO81135.1 GTP pyrophosphokinase [Pararhodospirillum oryzae]